ncbi:MAG: peptidase [Succinivibrionaceae bacterium]
MTYCVSMCLRDGMVFVSDTRTNAGIDHVATFNKLFHFHNENRDIVIQSAGNLATTQSVIALIRKGIELDSADNILKLPTMFEVTELVGRTVRQVISRDSSDLIDKSQLTSSFLVGGKIGDQPHVLYNVYPEGNFISTTMDTMYFQIGETKYGKPIIDRILSYDTNLTDALKLAMISVDSTIKSNLSVGLPIDILVIDLVNKRIRKRRLTAQDLYIQEIRKSWGSLIKQIFEKIPPVVWED